MYAFLWTCLLTLAGAFPQDTCESANLFTEFRDKFNIKDVTLKKSNSSFYRCLAMYDLAPNLKVDQLTIDRTSENTGNLASNLIIHISSGRTLSHTSHLPAFKSSCFVKSHLQKFYQQLDRYFKGGNDTKAKITCPLGLLWDIICNFRSCLESNCLVDGEVCEDSRTNSSCPRLNLKLFCKGCFTKFLKSCVKDDDILAMVNSIQTLEDKNCSNFSYIYQGLTSIQDVKKSVITSYCHESDEEKVSISCFNNGLFLEGATWWIGETILPVTRAGVLTLQHKDVVLDTMISCYQNSVKIAEINSRHIIGHCLTVESYKTTVGTRRNRDAATESQEASEVTDSPTEPTQESVSTTVTGTASSSSTTEAGHKKNMQDFYADTEVWLFDEEYGSLEGMDAFNNGETLLRNVDKLSVAVVSVMGRLTPICGEFWNKRAAEVFCRDAGTQVQQNWTTSYVGSLHKSENSRHQGRFYKHYLRNLACQGDEENIIWCEHDGWYHHSACKHDAVVICSEVKTDPGELLPLYYILAVIGGTIFLLLVLLYIGTKRYPNKFDALRSKFLKTCSHLNGPRDSTGQLDTNTTITAPMVMEQISQSDQKVSWSDSPDSLFYSMMDSISVNRSERDPLYSNELAFTAPPISENNLKRLNSCEAPESVLLYEKEEEVLVCKSFENVDESVDDMKTEHFFLSHVDHPNIVKCAAKEPAEIMFNNERKYFFFMERLEFGGLDSYLRGKDKNGFNNGHLMTVEDATNIIIGACRALHYVHSLGYVHADICSDNFFAFRNCNTGLLDVKLGDFETFYRPPAQKWRNIRCTPRCIAPEIILEHPKDENGQDIEKDPYKNDVWGLALVLWEVQSWVMCKNNMSTSKNAEQSTPTAPAQSSMMMSMSRFMRSRFEHPYDYTCRSQVHVALFQKINMVNPRAVSTSPDKYLVKEFYEKIHPLNIGYPPMNPKLDKKFGWPVTNLIKKCLRINSRNRSSMNEVMNHLLKNADSNNSSSPLTKYKDMLADDLKLGCNLLSEPLQCLPSTVQPNLGQIFV